MRLVRFILIAAAAAVWGSSASAQTSATIVIDYSLDTNGFFSGAAGVPRRTALETAANMLTSRLTDTLTAINPGGSNTWTASTFHPGTGASHEISNLTIPQNTILVFAGGLNLGGGTLGFGGPGGFDASGTQTFVNTVAARGQPGALGSQSTRTDFGPWGGSITFDTVGPNWNFSLSPPTTGQSDFLSIALHELGHLLGIGTADSWFNQISGGRFNGERASELNGGLGPFVSPFIPDDSTPDPDDGTPEGAHWLNGTTYLGQEAAMDPSLTQGTRKEFTELDFAGLDDLGWQVTPVPEPATVLGVGALGLTGVWSLRRRRAVRM